MNRTLASNGRSARRLQPRLLVAVATVMALGGLTACEVPWRQPEAPQQGSCPAGWQRVSSQSWWQKAGPDGTTLVPQELPASRVGGHLHVEPACFPLGQRVDGDFTLTVDIMTHQGFTGSGDRLDVGLAPGGSSIAQVPVNGPKLACSPKPGTCMQTVTVTVPAASLPAGPQAVRLRYLRTGHPNGERQVVSNEFQWFNKTNPSRCLETEGKSWFTGLDYSRAGIRSCLPGSKPVSGVYTFDQSARSTKLPITAMQTYVDARFGGDDFSGLVQTFTPPTSARSVTRSVSVDTTKLTDGVHCLQVVTQVTDGKGAVNTGVLEVRLVTANGNPAGNGRGGCL